MISPKEIYVIEYKRRDPRCFNWHCERIVYDRTREEANELLKIYTDKRFEYRCTTFIRENQL